jgi:hypothetical protein
MLFYSHVLVVDDQACTYETGMVMAEWRNDDEPAELIGALEVQGEDGGVVRYERDQIFAVLPQYDEAISEAIQIAYNEFLDGRDADAWMAFKVYLRMLLPSAFVDTVP